MNSGWREEGAERGPLGPLIRVIVKVYSQWDSQSRSGLPEVSIIWEIKEKGRSCEELGKREK